MTNNTSILNRVVKKAAYIESNELKATTLSFCLGFILMAAYFVMRPVRDSMASDWSDLEVTMLWNLNFFICVPLMLIYGYAVSRIKFNYLVPCIYTFFAASFILLYFYTTTSADRTLVEKTFYVWVSVFALFNISVFWSYMSDIYNKEQAKRLFAIIAAGVSAGALAGPLLPALFADDLGNDVLTLISATMLVLPIPIIFYLARLKTTDLNNEHVHADLSHLKISGNLFSGYKLFFTNPYLLTIGAFLFLYTVISSFIYFEQKNLLEIYDRETRTQILGSIDGLVNFLTFGLAFFATSRIVKKLGVGITLASMPMLVVIGALILAFAPLLTVLLALQVVRRAGEYAVTKPAREMLYTEVSKEERFKSKPIIDVVVYRGGDMFSANLFATLTERLGLGFTAVGIIGAGIAAVWGGIGLYLGRMYEKKVPQTVITDTGMEKLPT